MKKHCILIMTVIVLILNTGCGSSQDKAEQSTGLIQPQGNHQQVESFVDIIKQDHYYLECTAYIMGNKKQMTFAVQGKNCNTEIQGFGLTLRNLIRDGKTYIINKDKKVYAVSSVEGWMDLAKNGLVDYKKMKFVKKGRETIEDLKSVDQQKYEYEEYNVDTGNLIPVITYYFKGKELYAITTEVSDFSMTMIIKKLTGEVPKGTMTIPKGYKEVKESEVY